MNEAETTVRNQMKNQKGTEMFVHSAKLAAYNKLMGISPVSAYRQPGIIKSKAKSPVPQAKKASGEGKVDLSIFNSG